MMVFTLLHKQGLQLTDSDIADHNISVQTWLMDASWFKCYLESEQGQLDKLRHDPYKSLDWYEAHRNTRDKGELEPKDKKNYARSLWPFDYPRANVSITRKNNQLI